MIILRNKYFSNEKEDKKKGVGGALGIAAGSAGLGAAGGYGLYRNAKNKVNKEGEPLKNKVANLSKEIESKINLDNRFDSIWEKYSPLYTSVTEKYGKDSKIYNLITDHAYLNDEASSEALKKLENLDKGAADTAKKMKDLLVERNDLSKRHGYKEGGWTPTIRVKEDIEKLKPLKNEAEANLEKFNKGVAGRLKKNKKIAIGVGIGTAALGSLGAYGYYRNKNKK